MTTSAQTVLTRLRRLGNPAEAAHAQRFFKTGPGQYGEGDRFLGIRVPRLRQYARELRDLPPDAILELLRAPLHEARLLALLLLVARFRAARAARARHALYQAYLAHTRFINNWDLVDVSAEHLVGAWLFARSRAPLFRLVRSRSLWERRIALLATFHFIRKNEFADTLALVRLLLDDREDLIHKAAGWMLREIGKRDRATLVQFLAKHGRAMPRTMLRYAIEKFSPAQRRDWLRRTRGTEGVACGRPA